MKLQPVFILTSIIFGGFFTSACSSGDNVDDLPVPDNAAAAPENSIAAISANQSKDIESVVFIEMTSSDGYDELYSPDSSRIRSYRFAFVAGIYDLATPHSEDMITELTGFGVLGCDASSSVEGNLYRSESGQWSPAIDLTRLPGTFRTQLPSELNVVNDGQVFSQLTFISNSNDYNSPHYAIPDGFVQIEITDNTNQLANRPESLSIDIAPLLTVASTESTFVLPVINVPEPDRQGLFPPPSGYLNNFYTGSEINWHRYGSDFLIDSNIFVQLSSELKPEHFNDEEFAEEKPPRFTRCLTEDTGTIILPELPEAGVSHRYNHLHISRRHIESRRIGNTMVLVMSEAVERPGNVDKPLSNLWR